MIARRWYWFITAAAASMSCWHWRAASPTTVAERFGVTLEREPRLLGRALP